MRALVSRALILLGLATCSFAVPQLQVSQRPPHNPAGSTALTPHCVATIPDLLALPPATPASGVRCVNVLGFAAPGDGGGGLFYWDENAGTTPDGGIVFASTHPQAPPAARWIRVFNGAVRASFFGLKGDSTDETQALQAALSAAAGRTLVFDRPGLFGFMPPLTIPADCKIENHGATFLLLADPGGASVAVLAEDRVTADLLRVHVAAGVPVRRLLLLQDDTDVEKIVLSSTDRQSTLSSTLDGALQVRGTSVHIGDVTVSDFDYPVTCYLASQVVVDRCRITDYIRGFLIRESDFVHLLSAWITEPSPGATTVPGHNGILLHSANDVQISNVAVHDAGEHAVRVGGGEAARLVFSDIQTIRPGQCGLKINPFSGTLVRDVQISGLTVVDASATSTTGTNEDGLRLEKCAHVIVDGFQVQRRNLARSCNVGIYLNGCTNVTLNGPRITDTASHGIHMQDIDGVVNEIYVNQPSILTTGGHGVFIESPTQVLRDITLMDAFIRNQSGWGIRLQANSPTVGVNQPVILDGWIKNDGFGGYSVSTSDSDVHVSIQVVN